MIGKNLPIIIAPDARLKQPIRDIHKMNNDNIQLIQDLLTTLKIQNAIGLTAAHLGMTKSIVVIKYR
jgi:peptide deformylase